MSNKNTIIESLPGGSPKYSIRRLFLKQVLFKAVPAEEADDIKPGTAETKIRINISHIQIDEDDYEVSLDVHAQIGSSKEEQSNFELSFNQSGVFTFRSVLAQELPALLYIDCPEALFPYARELMDSLMIKAGLHPLSMVMPDFKQLFSEMQNKQKRTFEPELWGEADPDKEPITH